MTRLLTAVLLLAAGLAAAQTPASPAAAPVDRTTIRRENSARRAQIAALNAQEKAAMDAVTANAALSKSDGNAAKRKIHADFKSKKDTIRAQMRIARKSAHGVPAGLPKR